MDDLSQLFDYFDRISFNKFLELFTSKPDESELSVRQADPESAAIAGAIEGIASAAVSLFAVSKSSTIISA